MKGLLISLLLLLTISVYSDSYVDLGQVQDGVNDIYVETQIEFDETIVFGINILLYFDQEQMMFNELFDIDVNVWAGFNIGDIGFRVNQYMNEDLEFETKAYIRIQFD